MFHVCFLSLEGSFNVYRNLVDAPPPLRLPFVGFYSLEETNG
jgi:hypothetical protein